MLTHAGLVLLLFTTPAVAQELDTAVRAVVRISGSRGDTPVRGSGLVVGLDQDKVTILTAAHVIEGAQRLEVTFAADLTESFPAGAVLGIDAANPNGLATFQVRGALPASITVLSLEVESRPRAGDALFLLGFPQLELSPRTIQRVLSARRGTLLLIDQEIGEGFSGGPVLQGGKVVGVVTEMDGQTTYAVNAVVAREALEGWGSKLGFQNSSPGTPPTLPRPAAPAFKSCTSGEERTENGIVYVRICPGTFTMGSAVGDPQADGDEKPTHQVTLSEFWLGKTEISNDQYRRFRQDHQGAARLPATNISWVDAQDACQFFGGQLPTEAQWEYAARAGSRTAWSFGNDKEKLDEYAWHSKNSGKPQTVGKKKPNAWGLYDMHGNVSEWAADWYGPYSSAAQVDPLGPPAGEYRVRRGGAFFFPPTVLRSADRGRDLPELQSGFVGFRCAHSPHHHP